MFFLLFLHGNCMWWCLGPVCEAENRQMCFEWVPVIDTYSLTLIYCLSHAGVRGSERVDFFASRVAVAGKLTMDKEDILKVTYEGSGRYNNRLSNIVRVA